MKAAIIEMPNLAKVSQNSELVQKIRGLLIKTTEHYIEACKKVKELREVSTTQDFLNIMKTEFSISKGQAYKMVQLADSWIGKEKGYSKLPKSIAIELLPLDETAGKEIADKAAKQNLTVKEVREEIKSLDVETNSDEYIEADKTNSIVGNKESLMFKSTQSSEQQAPESTHNPGKTVPGDNPVEVQEEPAKARSDNDNMQALHIEIETLKGENIKLKQDILTMSSLMKEQKKLQDEQRKTFETEKEIWGKTFEDKVEERIGHREGYSKDLVERVGKIMTLLEGNGCEWDGDNMVTIEYLAEFYIDHFKKTRLMHEMIDGINSSSENSIQVPEQTKPYPANGDITSPVMQAIEQTQKADREIFGQPKTKKQPQPKAEPQQTEEERRSTRINCFGQIDRLQRYFYNSYAILDKKVRNNEQCGVYDIEVFVNFSIKWIYFFGEYPEMIDDTRKMHLMLNKIIEEVGITKEKIKKFTKSGRNKNDEQNNMFKL